jgi:cytochrome c551/c552
MPVPTDTFWNIRRLNIVFAISAVALLLVTGWSIIQDYEREWRKPQQSAMAWEAAFTTDKIERALTPEQQTRVDEITAEIDRQNNTLNISGGEVEKLKATIRDLEGERSNLEFSLNNLKAEATVTESQLQDARTAGDTARIAALEAKLNTKSMDKRTGRELSTLEKIASDTEQMFQWAQQIASAKADLADRTLAIADLTKERTKLLEERDRLQKRRDALQPANLIAKASAAGRRIPLLQFVNPSEKVQQIVLPDVLSEMPPMKVAAIDRCTTCHININKKDFTVDKVVTFLEEQAATTNFFNLPDVASGKSSDARATDNEPGPVASPEFWHGWAVRLSPETLKKNEARLKAIAKAVTDKIVTVTFDGQPVDAFAYALAAAPSTAPSTAPAHDETDASADHSRQDEILLAIIKSLYRYSAGDPTHNAAEYGRATAQVVANADEKKVTTARTAAMKYPEEIQAALKAQLDEKQYRLLSDRYRYALVDVVNAARKTEGLAALDPSPVLLAHPRLDLYVDVDSKHSLETVGCTSCHDGSGLETDFVLAAHFPREIWVDEKTGEPVLADQLDATRMDESHHAADLSNMLGAIYPHGEPIPAQVADIHIELASDEAVEEHRGPTDPQNATEKTKPVPYLDPVTGRESRAVSQMTYWIKKYEPVAPRSFALVYHEWDWPMRPFKYLEANCTRCHTDVYDIKEEAPVISEGRQLFTQMGCVNCHQMDSIPAEQNRKVGTDLRHVTAKLSPEYINTWIFAPKSFRPSTKMPHFFMLENNSSDEELRRTRQEARAMTEYIVRTATPQLLKHPIPSGLKGSAEAGKTVFNSIGCLGCHTNLNEVGDKWITTDLTKRLGMKPAEAKALYEGMTYNERQMYVLENLAEPSDGSVPRYADGTATKAGTPKPIFVHHGPELSGIGTKLLAGRAEDDARAFLFDWLKEPRHYSNYTVMPQLRLTDQQIADVTEYLLAQKRTTKSPDDAWTAGLTPVDTPKLIELTAFFLRSQYSIKVASEKADDLATLRQLAFDAWPNNREDKETAAAAIDAMGEDKDTLRMVFLGKKLIGHYGCMSCHSINGTETISSPCANLSDWGQKRIDKLDFAFLDHHKAEGLPPTSKIEMVNGVSAEAGVLGHVLPDTGWAEPTWITRAPPGSRRSSRTHVFTIAARICLSRGEKSIRQPANPCSTSKMTRSSLIRASRMTS